MYCWCSWEFQSISHTQKNSKQNHQGQAPVVGGLGFKMNCKQRQVVLATLQIKNDYAQKSRAAKQTRGSGLFGRTEDR